VTPLCVHEPHICRCQAAPLLLSMRLSCWSLGRQRSRGRLPPPLLLLLLLLLLLPPLLLPLLLLLLPPLLLLLLPLPLLPVIKR